VNRAWSLLLLCGACANDPASVFARRSDARNLDCVRLSQEEAARQHPGQVPEAPARGANLSLTDVLVCQRQMLEPGERPARDEAILSSLTRDVGELVNSASVLEPAPNATWHVDAFYPDARVASKIAVAARTQLAEKGRAVSDRVPLLAAGDLAVMGKRPFHESFPLACARYFAEGSLHEPSVFLALMIIDPREAELHAGVCARGAWRWLR
jgi:hypothetical protein